jgi:hypothetical protein
LDYVGVIDANGPFVLAFMGRSVFSFYRRQSAVQYVVCRDSSRILLNFHQLMLKFLFLLLTMLYTSVAGALIGLEVLPRLVVIESSIPRSATVLYAVIDRTQALVLMPSVLVMR